MGQVSAGGAGIICCGRHHQFGKPGGGSDKRPRVGGTRMSEEIPDRALLAYLSLLQHEHAVCDARNDPQIV